MAASDTTQKRRVLILNDDPDLVELMISVLTDTGYEVSSSVTRDLREVVRSKPEVILLDCPPGDEKQIVNFAQQLLAAIPPLWFYGGLAFIGTLYAVFVGVGAVAYRYLYRSN